jgi:hypothetical protein
MKMDQTTEEDPHIGGTALIVVWTAMIGICLTFFYFAARAILFLGFLLGWGR